MSHVVYVSNLQRLNLFLIVIGSDFGYVSLSWHIEWQGLRYEIVGRTKAFESYHVYV